jgi:hypothetical protein
LITPCSDLGLSPIAVPRPGLPEIRPVRALSDFGDAAMRLSLAEDLLMILTLLTFPVFTMLAVSLFFHDYNNL